MLVGERFFADKLTVLFKPLKRGEIIAFNDPTYNYSTSPIQRTFQNYVWGPSNWTKRVIGIPGDRVRGTVENGRPVVYINDVKLNEPYLNKYPLVLTYRADISLDRLRCMKEQELMKNVVPRSLDPSS